MSDPLRVAALVLVAVGTLDAWRAVGVLYGGYVTSIAGGGRRVQRLGIRRMGQAVIRYQTAVGVALALLGIGTGAITLLGSAAMWRLGLWCWDHGLGSPWWAAGVR